VDTQGVRRYNVDRDAQLTDVEAQDNEAMGRSIDAGGSSSSLEIRCV
jgi:hypothetical protein